MDAIERLAQFLDQREIIEPGQQTRLARHLAVSPGLVWQWLNRKRPIAPVHALGIERYTEGFVTPYMVAPKVFGTPDQQRGRAAGD